MGEIQKSERILQAILVIKMELEELCEDFPDREGIQIALRANQYLIEYWKGEHATASL